MERPPVDQGPGGRPAVEVLAGRAADVGGATVQRLLPRRGHRTVGAWCFLDHFGPAPVSAGAAMTIGPHPHTGLQTVTWLLEGELLHTDSVGSHQRIRPGQLNLMSAGHGVAHAEDSRGIDVATMRGVQLWVAQPEATRHSPPAFEHHADLPRIDLLGATATVLIGSFAGETSPARTDTALVGVDLVLDGRVALPVDPTHEHAVAVVSGAADVDGTTVATDAVGYLAPGADEIVVHAPASTRVLLLGGEPFGEEILMWWNLVARSRDEIEQAAHDWNEGSERFGVVATDLDRIPAPMPNWSTSG